MTADAMPHYLITFDLVRAVDTDDGVLHAGRHVRRMRAPSPTSAVRSLSAILSLRPNIADGTMTVVSTVPSFGPASR